MIAGPRQTNSEGQRIHRELAERIRAVLDDQRLVSLDTLLALGDGLTPTPQGTPAGDRLLPLAEQLGEFQMPRPIFTNSERTTFTAGSYNNRHTEIEMRTDLAKMLKSQVLRTGIGTSPRTARSVPARHARRFQLRLLRTAGLPGSAQ